MNIKVNTGWTLALLSVVSFPAFSNDLRLAEAVKKQDKETVRSLLRQHVDVNTPEGDGATALVWAAHWNDTDTADLLIRAGANVNTMNDYGVTPLWEACNNANAAMAEKLINAGANPNAALLRTGETALWRCARTGNADAVKSLVAHGADINAKERQKDQTALMWALEERHPEAARVLIEHGADVHARSKGGFTPLLFAARQGDVTSARLLLEKGAEVNETLPDHLQPLLVAIDCNHEAFAMFLVEKGANVNMADRNGLTPLHYALRKGISVLRGVEHDSQIAGLRDYLLRPNMPELVKALLEHGANPNARIKVDLARMKPLDQPQLGLAGATPFLLAAATGDVGIMRALLANGADPNLATSDHTTPLMGAAGVGRREDRTNEEERQALEAVKFLLDLGGDVNAANKQGLTALHGAAYIGANGIIQLLADKGARLDLMDRFGLTPLSIAEGDPNALSAEDFGLGRPVTLQPHESTANLLRKLGGETPAQGAGTVSANATE